MPRLANFEGLPRATKKSKNRKNARNPLIFTQTHPWAHWIKFWGPVRHTYKIATQIWGGEGGGGTLPYIYIYIYIYRAFNNICPPRTPLLFLRFLEYPNLLISFVQFFLGQFYVNKLFLIFFSFTCQKSIFPKSRCFQKPIFLGDFFLDFWQNRSSFLCYRDRWFVKNREIYFWQS